jgi:hypothetical protein
VQFVYEAHIAPHVERWAEEFINGREQRRARQLQRERAAAVKVEAGGVRDFTRTPRDEKDERARRASAADNWRRLSESVNELDNLREKQDASRAGVDVTTSTSGLRRRTHGPMDEVYTFPFPALISFFADHQNLVVY